MPRHRSTLRIPSLAGGLLLAAACTAPPPPLPPPDAVAVGVEVVARGPHAPTLPLLGVVRPAELVPIRPTRGGVVTYPERFARGLRTGEPVTRGELLATVRNDELLLEIDEQASQLGHAERELERVHLSVQQGITTDAELAQAEHERALWSRRLAASRAEAAKLSLRAPRAGRLVVAEVAPPGTEVGADTVLAEVVAEGAPRIEAWAAAGVREELRVGLPVEVRRAGGGELPVEGVLEEVAPVVDEGGTVRVIASVASAAGLPAPGEGVELDVRLAERPDAITVPREALVRESGSTAVWVAEGGRSATSARRRAVEPGRSGAGRVEVRRGLEAGDRVIVSGLDFLTEGRAVAPTEVAPEAGRESGR